MGFLPTLFVTISLLAVLSLLYWSIPYYALHNGFMTALNLKKKYYLSAIATYRNDEVIIREWVGHMVEQGVEHLFLVDLGPSTDSTRFQLLVLENAGIITFLDGGIYEGPKSTLKAIQAHWALVTEQSEWVIVGDVNEFPLSFQASSGPHDAIYSAPVDDSRNVPGEERYQHAVKAMNAPVDAPIARRVLANRFERKADYIQVPNVYFGSSMHSKQPSSVLCHFTKRADYDTPPGSVRVTEQNNPFTDTKFWVRTSAIDTTNGLTSIFSIASSIPAHRRFWGHTANVITRADTKDGPSAARGMEEIFTPLSEELISSALLLNFRFQFLSRSHHKWLVRQNAKSFYVSTGGGVAATAANSSSLHKTQLFRGSAFAHQLMMRQREFNEYNEWYNSKMETHLTNMTSYCISG